MIIELMENIEQAIYTSFYHTFLIFSFYNGLNLELLTSKRLSKQVTFHFKIF